MAIAAVRCFGDEQIRSKLKVKTAVKQVSADALKATRVYKEIISELTGNPAAAAQEKGRNSLETQDEYRRIQVQAASSDKPLNKALGELFNYALSEDLPSVEIEIEKQSLAGTTLKPDIKIKITDTDMICLEPTWRSSGKEVPDEIKQRQSTLAEGHLKQYVLNKTLDYVKAIGL